MSAQAHARTRTRSGTRKRPTKAQRQRRKKLLRRRLMLLAFAVTAICVLGIVIVRPFADKAVQEISLPLRHEDIIRQQARNKGLDPSLIAGVIYVESRFRDQTSVAGAKGLMQILPSTAQFIAHKSGGTAFELRDLGTPQINISYGAWYLRYLKEKYEDRDLAVVAAYNAGEGKVDEWYRDASARGEDFEAATHIPFPETRSYVGSVLEVRTRYRNEYRRELGL